jgi:hypothetical protein
MRGFPLSGGPLKVGEIKPIKIQTIGHQRRYAQLKRLTNMANLR